jgi:hypothetical protein
MPTARRGFCLAAPWMGRGAFPCVGPRFRRFARDYEWLSVTVAGLDFRILA